MKLADLPREALIRKIVTTMLNDFVHAPTIDSRILEACVKIYDKGWVQFFTDRPLTDEMMIQVKVALITRIQYRS